MRRIAHRVEAVLQMRSEIELGKAHAAANL